MAQQTFFQRSANRQFCDVAAAFQPRALLLGRVGDPIEDFVSEYEELADFRASEVQNVHALLSPPIRNGPFLPASSDQVQVLASLAEHSLCEGAHVEMSE
jgi:hypothetical protein